MEPYFIKTIQPRNTRKTRKKTYGPRVVTEFLGWKSLRGLRWAFFSTRNDAVGAVVDNGGGVHDFDAFLGDPHGQDKQTGKARWCASHVEGAGGAGALVESAAPHRVASHGVEGGGPRHGLGAHDGLGALVSNVGEGEGSHIHADGVRGHCIGDHRAGAASLGKHQGGHPDQPG